MKYNLARRFDTYTPQKIKRAMPLLGKKIHVGFLIMIFYNLDKNDKDMKKASTKIDSCNSLL
jgi:hypothetical protein